MHTCSISLAGMQHARTSHELEQAYTIVNHKSWVGWLLPCHARLYVPSVLARSLAKGICAMQVPAECPQDIADLVEHCLSMEPQSRPSARDVFNVITTVQLAQEQQAAQDPWDANEGPHHLAAGDSQPSAVSHAKRLQQPGHSRHQAAARPHERNHDSV